MELEFTLSRKADEPWGFRLIGGSDFSIPLTVVKVLPNSPAARAGVANGDTVVTINYQNTTEMTHEDSRKVLADCDRGLVLGVVRGLYDPVLDDFDPIYEIDQDDSDQPLQTSEVFTPTQFSSEPADLTNAPHLQLCDFPDYIDPRKLHGLVPKQDFEPLSEEECRSLTASPFVLPTKPFRPFSTTPLPEVPPLEEPIILNPDYHDDFTIYGIDEDLLPKSKFKLPISPQYDPDGTKLKKDTTTTTSIDISSTERISETKSVTEARESSEVNLTSVSKTKTDMKDQIQLEDVQFKEKIKQEMDLENIEKTATSIVHDSLEKAVTIAQDISNEISFELDTLKSGCVEQFIDDFSLISQVSKEKAVSEIKELVDIIDKTTEQLSDKVEVRESVIEKAEKFETNAQQLSAQSIDEQKQSVRKEIEETIEIGSVKRKSTAFDKEAEETSKIAESKAYESRKSDVSVKQTDVREDVTKSYTTQNKIIDGETRTKTGARMSTAKLLSEQRAYTIGLQTIPNIKGTIHSSYHYDLLLKTFFIHLTDVMVALSRFILAEPVLADKATSTDKLESAKVQEQAIKKDASETVCRMQEAVVKEVISKDVSEAVKVQKEVVTQKETEVQAVKVADVRKTEDFEVKRAAIETSVTEQLKKDHLQDQTEVRDTEAVEKKMISGSKMAQLVEKKSEDLTHKMDAVITEFQTKSGVEEISSKTMQDDKSSNVEALSKSDIKTSISEVKTTESTSETKESSKLEKRAVQTIQRPRYKPKTTRPTYVAIVESHTYTNKDVVLEEHFSGCSSLQSPEDTPAVSEVIDTKDTLVNERVALKEEVYKAADKKVSDIIAIDESIKNTENLAMQATNLVQKAATTDLVQKSVSTDVVQKQEATASTEKIELKSAKVSQEVFLDKTDSESVTFTESKQEQTAIIDKKEVEMKSDIKEVSQTSLKDETLFKKQEISQKISELTSEKDFAKSIKESHLEEKSMSVKESTEKQETKIMATEKVRSHQDLHIIKKPVIAHVGKPKSILKKEYAIKKDTDESAALKITKEQVKEVESLTKIELEKSDLSITNSSFIIDNRSQMNVAVEKHEQKETKSDQESTFIAKSVVNEEVTHKARNLTLDLNGERKLEKQASSHSSGNVSSTSDDSPTATPTAYMFKLQIPLPKGITPVPPDPTTPSPEDEDPNIVKKKLLPYIDTTIGERVVYDPPLPTPPGSHPTSPVYSKPGLKGGADKEDISKEEIREITRKSSLLATAIDETIKSIEEYKQEVGMENINTQTETNNTTDNIVYNGYAKVVATKVYDDFNKATIEKVGQNGANGKTPEECNKTANNNTEYAMINNTNCNTIDKNVEVQAVNINKGVDLNEMDNNDISNENNKISDSSDTIEGYRPVQFDPQEIQNVLRNLRASQMRELMQVTSEMRQKQQYRSASGDLIGTKQGIVDGLEDAVVDEEVAKELGKPGMTEDKIAELISGESEMLREAHVMGLSRVISAHMHKPSDSSVDFKRIKPLIESLNDSEVLKALNEEILKAQEERKKKEEKKWTTFLQKPQRPVPKVKFGCHGYVPEQEQIGKPYKVKIVKQPKPKVAPDYKPENFNTGLLPWEERALREPTPPPVEPEDPILVPEEAPEILEAVDPLPESEVPDLEDSGIPLPPPKPIEEATEQTEVTEQKEEEELDIEAIVEETQRIVEENVVEEMDENTLAEKLIMDVQNMLDPNSPLEQQLSQMRAQLTALARLPAVIQNSLELLTTQLAQLSTKDTTQTTAQIENQTTDAVEEVQRNEEPREMNNIEAEQQNEIEPQQEQVEQVNRVEEKIEQVPETVEDQEKREERDIMKSETEKREVMQAAEEIMNEQCRIEKQKKELMHQMKAEQEARQLKQRSPRVGKPKPMFGPITPQERPLVLPGGRKWRKPQDAYNDQFIAETLTAQAEIIMGKAKGCSFESVLLPYDERVNFMKWEKPPVNLDHLKDSDTYKLIHNMEDGGMKKVAMRTPVMAEVDYREKCRSVTPCSQMQP